MRKKTSSPNDGAMPHKNECFTYCATSSETATLLSVVSVMRRNSDGSWHGDMLDGLAFVTAQKNEGAQPAFLARGYGQGPDGRPPPDGPCRCDVQPTDMESP